MSGTTFGALHARALSHATEDLDKVKRALANVLGDAELSVSRTEGHHGNPIAVLEAVIEDSRSIDDFFRRITADDLRALVESIGNRVDEGCNLFLKLDKQAAFAGEARLGAGDDVISVRVRARVFPAKRDIAMRAVVGYLGGILERRDGEP